MVEVAGLLLYPEELRQLVSRVPALERSAIAAGLCMWRDIYAGTRRRRLWGRGVSWGGLAC